MLEAFGYCLVLNIFITVERNQRGNQNKKHFYVAKSISWIDIQISLGCQYLWGDSGSGDCLMFYWNDKSSLLFSLYENFESLQKRNFILINF